MSARDAVIVAAVRTPVGVGRPGKGHLESIHPVDLSALVIRELMNRTGVDPALVGLDYPTQPASQHADQRGAHERGDCGHQADQEIRGRRRHERWRL